MKSDRKTHSLWANSETVLLYLLVLILLLLPACDCGSSDSSDGAKSDDDAVIDDDTSADDDADDDAGTTTTTSPTTSTIPTSSTTTTVVTTSSTTTTIPGSGTACDPYRYTAVDGPDVPDFGPWPEYTIGAITYRQYISGSAGVGTNAVALGADGRVYAFGMVGRSFDAYVFDDDGSVEREVVDPSGGMYSDIHRDAAGAFHVVYMNNNHNELRYATDATGEWVVTVLREIPEGNIGFSSALGADGTLHIEYTHNVGGANNVRYLSWNGGVVVDEEVMPSDGSNWFWGFSVALDPAGEVHMVSSGDAGVWHRVREDGVWTSEQIAGTSSETDMMIDDQGVIRVAIQGRSGGLSLATKSAGLWTTETIDDCSAGSVHVRMSRDAAGVYHLVYPTANYGAFRHASNAGGTWTIEQINGTPGYYLGGIVAPDGTVHAAACSIVDEKLFYATNATGPWQRRKVAGGREFGFSNFAVDADGEPHFVFAESREPEHGRMFYATTAGGWRRDEIDADAYDYHADIAISPVDGSIFISYVDHYGESTLKFAQLSDLGWQTETLYSNEDLAWYSVVRADPNGIPYVSFQYQDSPSLGYRTSSTWSYESIPMEVGIADMAITEPGEVQYIGRELPLDPSRITYVKKYENGDWISEVMTVPTWRDRGPLEMDVDASGDVHAIYCCNTTGVGYVSNKSGIWTTQVVGDWLAYDNSFSIAVDEFGISHISVVEFDNYRPGQSGTYVIYYVTNINSEFEYFAIDDRWLNDAGTNQIQWLSNGNLMIMYQASESICTATFEPGLE